MLEKYIFTIRGHRVMLSTHLAELYGVEARILVQAVKRNKDRFPDDFMFQLTQEEMKNLRSQIVILEGRGGRRYHPNHQLPLTPLFKKRGGKFREG